jgi:hypothetical protein
VKFTLCKSLSLIHTRNHPVGIANLANDDDDNDDYDDKSKNNGDGQATVQSVPPDVKTKIRIHLECKDFLIRKSVEGENNDYRITDETVNTAMAFQPQAISLQYNPDTEISLPYTAQKSRKGTAILLKASPQTHLIFKPFLHPEYQTNMALEL